jgi:AraC-like DNA-binding protein
MTFNPQSAASAGQLGAVASHYGSFITSGERFNGVWEEKEGLAFLDREWRRSLYWEAPRREIEGFYNFYIQSKSHLQCGEFNGAPSRNHCRIGAVQIMQPDETVHTAGVGPTRIFQISMSPAYLTSYVERNFVMPSGVDLKTRQLDDVGLAKLARTHNQATLFGLPMRQLYFDQLREAMLHRILSLYSTHKCLAKERAESLVPAKTRLLLDFVEANLDQDLRLDELARIAGLSRAHFARSFHKMIGMSPHLYVQHRRLNRAAELLRGRAHSIKDIADLSGFADASHLTRCFKHSFGAVPSEARALFEERAQQTSASCEV